jgi:hypothetical protein
VRSSKGKHIERLQEAPHVGLEKTWSSINEGLELGLLLPGVAHVAGFGQPRGTTGCKQEDADADADTKQSTEVLGRGERRRRLRKGNRLASCVFP